MEPGKVGTSVSTGQRASGETESNSITSYYSPSSQHKPWTKEDWDMHAGERFMTVHWWGPAASGCPPVWTQYAWRTMNNNIQTHLDRHNSAWCRYLHFTWSSKPHINLWFCGCVLQHCHYSPFVVAVKEHPWFMQARVRNPWMTSGLPDWHFESAKGGI